MTILFRATSDLKQNHYDFVTIDGVQTEVFVSKARRAVYAKKTIVYYLFLVQNGPHAKQYMYGCLAFNEHQSVAAGGLHVVATGFPVPTDDEQWIKMSELVA